jgi:hypothetical protein
LWPLASRSAQLFDELGHDSGYQRRRHEYERSRDIAVEYPHDRLSWLDVDCMLEINRDRNSAALLDRVRAMGCVEGRIHQQKS